MAILSYFLLLLKTWGKIWIAPLGNFEMLWILIPIYLAWIFTEIYQEKKGTSLGNAISNGIVALWIGMDWSRITVRLATTQNLPIDFMFFAKIGGAVFFILYGLLIIIDGIRVKKITHYIGRIREVSYLAIMITPVFYGVIAPNLETFLAILIFFPIFYFIIELICRLTPNPTTYDEDEMPSAGKDMPELGDLGQMPSEPAMPEAGRQMQDFGGGAPPNIPGTGQNFRGFQ